MTPRRFQPPAEQTTVDCAQEVAPSVAHRAVARLMQAGTIRVVLTVNFDRLFEKALQDF
jgi:NAD-dependent SIR2 family protein deacetylase